jgi:uncharacterized membrane protein YciS (DUF1049 family)
MKKISVIIKSILLFILILFIVMFSITNSDIVKVSFGFFPIDFSIEIRMFLLIVFSFSSGFLCGILSVSYNMLLKYFEIFKYKKNLKKAEEKSKK